MNSLEQVVENSIQKLKRTFYKVIKNDNNIYSIIIYDGPTKPVRILRQEGWTKIPSDFISDITLEHPYFNINNYKYSPENDKLERKTSEDKLRETLKQVNSIFLFDKTDILRVLLTHVKSLFNLFNIDFLKFKKFNDLIEAYNVAVDLSETLTINDKSNYLAAMSEYIQNIENELKVKVHIFNPRKYLNKNFKLILVLIDEV